MINVEERYDGSYMCQFRTIDDELITEVYYGYSKEEAMTEFKKLIKDKEKEFGWSMDDELNARICEATDGMCSLSHTGGSHG